MDIALDYITGEIANGNLGPGDKLPNEKDLAQQLGISRTPIREAIKTLAVSGIVETRHGFGNYIRDNDGLPAMPLAMFQLYLQSSTPEMLMELRYVFDRNCSELASLRRSDADLAVMRECIDRLKRLSDDPDSPIEELLKADLDFHRAIYKAAGNPLIVLIADFVLNMVAPWVQKSLEVSGKWRAVDLHEHMYAMIRDRKTGDLSRESVEENMEHFRTSLLK
ncbi:MULTISPECIES: FadR/GntR family transcriptional regulator [Rhizobium]|uniref:FadR/GntR family transcriptional regulator n=1 Tax=Rhizobium TaxID=379 RepID=UPI001FEA0B4B|nr:MULTISPECIES: GntR family transcriptional regulator [Rhizobium]